ncbi:hypothetical protein RB653_002810 [Dictyostelium firmibasis]|uniref:RRM domain-containing protein n=1 Tax=Dictyostelium firmibasis TaxID=79012 RepID=A0AAN7TPH8_9MYCE
MSNKLYVGWSTNEDSLRNAFSSYGNVIDAQVVRDSSTGRTRGFGYVTFENGSIANNAVSGLQNFELDGRIIKVNIANTGPSVGGGSYNTQQNKPGYTSGFGQ